MYTTTNFQTKKELKEAVAKGVKLTVYQPGPFGHGIETGDQTVYLEGPHYPEAHRWYAKGTLKDGVLVKVI